MRKKDEYHVEYKSPYYYIFGSDNHKHFGFFKMKDEAEWRCAWLNSLQAREPIMAQYSLYLDILNIIAIFVITSSYQT